MIACIVPFFVESNFIGLSVERRRRDKINTWINKLAKVVPECVQEQSKAGQVGGTQAIVRAYCF